MHSSARRPTQETARSALGHRDQYGADSPISVGAGPAGIAIAAMRAYVSNGQDNTISVIDLTTNTAIEPAIATGHTPLGIALTPDGSRAYATLFGDNRYRAKVG